MSFGHFGPGHNLVKSLCLFHNFALKPIYDMCLRQSVKNLKQNITVLDTQTNEEPNAIISSLYLKNGAILEGYQCHPLKKTTVRHKFLFTYEMPISFSVTPLLESLTFLRSY